MMDAEKMLKKRSNCVCSCLADVATWIDGNHSYALTDAPLTWQGFFVQQPI